MDCYIFPGLHDYIKSVVVKNINNKLKYASASRVTELICNYFNVTLDELKSKRRLKNITDARHWIIYILYNYNKMTLAQIGRILNKNHATCIHAIRRIEAQSEIYPDINETKENLIKLINND